MPRQPPTRHKHSIYFLSAPPAQVHLTVTPPHTGTLPQDTDPAPGTGTPPGTPDRKIMRFISPSKMMLPKPLRIFTLKSLLKSLVTDDIFEFCTLTILQPIQYQILLTVTISEAISFKVKPVNYTLKLTLLCFFGIKRTFLPGNFYFIHCN